MHGHRSRDRFGAIALAEQDVQVGEHELRVMARHGPQHHAAQVAARQLLHAFGREPLQPGPGILGIAVGPLPHDLRHPLGFFIVGPTECLGRDRWRTHGPGPGDFRQRLQYRLRRSGQLLPQAADQGKVVVRPFPRGRAARCGAVAPRAIPTAGGTRRAGAFLPRAAPIRRRTPPARGRQKAPSGLRLTGLPRLDRWWHGRDWRVPRNSRPAPGASPSGRAAQRPSRTN